MLKWELSYIEKSGPVLEIQLLCTRQIGVCQEKQKDSSCSVFGFSAVGFGVIEYAQ